jgi:hypothetical protein
MMGKRRGNSPVRSVRTVMKRLAYGMAGIAASVVIATAAIAAGTQNSNAATASTSNTTSASAIPSPSATTPTPAVTKEPVSIDALAAIDADGRFAVSVVDTGTGESLTYGKGSFDTASIVKVDILAALLYQAQQDGRTLTVSEQSLAAAMIERSDNTAATALFNQVGGKAGLEAFNEVIGLKDTEVGSNGNWGLTQTTAADQIRLLKVVFEGHSVLMAASQAYEQGLMSQVIDSQNFGVSAAADDADDAVLKVGYLQRSATALWDVTSIGEIEADGHTYLVAVLSDSNTSFDHGVALVDQVAEAAVDALS